MSIQQDWDKTKLVEYLHYDKWEIPNAWNLLVGHLTLDNPLLFNSEGVSEEMVSEYNHLKELWYKKPIPFSRFMKTSFRPTFIISWAISNNHKPIWLDWAKQRNLYPIDEKEPFNLSKGETVEAKPASTPEPVTKTNKLRRNNLDPAIDKAINKAGNMKLADVYLELKCLALAEEKPFTGALDGDALCYTDDNNQPAKLSKEALGKRLKRR